MKICRVLGTVTSTAKQPVYVGQKLMVVQPLDEELEPQGHSYLAIDRVQAGKGDLVLVNSEGGAARALFNREVICIRSMITGIIDEVDVPC